MEIPLSQLETGKTAKVKRLMSGFGLQRKTLSLGVRIGKSVRVVSSQPFRGPIVVELDNMKIAIGRSIANKIIVET